MKNGIPKIIKILLVIVAILICVAVYATVIYVNQKSKAEEIAKKKEEENKKLYTVANYPKVDASLATQPLTDAFMKNFTGEENIEKATNYTNTHPGYVRLINGEVDLIVVTEPSKEELEYAKQKGVELEVIPVVKEGFVFYVNKENKVEDLTIDQIQGIYTGSIKNWKQVGGEYEDIIPYQRPVNSGSQTGMLSLVMKGKNLMSAPKEKLVDSMFEIVNLVSNYDNGKNAIGYSYYYYATTMFQTIDPTIANNVKLLGINGVKPTNQTIKDGTYPFTTAYYIVINKEAGENSPARILANYMLSDRGQRVAEEAGYVPVK